MFLQLQLAGRPLGLLSLFLGLSLIASVACCGVGVHLTIARRNQDSWPAEIQAYDEYIRAGAFFPDAFYSCAGLSYAAEAAHWPPFLKAAVHHYHEKKLRLGRAESELRSQATTTTTTTTTTRKKWYQKVLGTHKHKQPRVSDSSIASDRSELNALRAFIYSMLTHQVADVSWHSLGVPQGLLQVMSKREFGGDTDSAHSTLDVGGDLIHMGRLLSSKHDTQWYKGSWNYPSQDLVEIFARVGYKVSKSQLEYCMLRGNAAILAELQIAQDTFDAYARRSPLLFDELQSYYMGGLDEIVLSTQHCTRRLDSWFDNYNDEWDNRTVDWDICQVFDGMRHRQKSLTAAANQPHVHTNFPSLVERLVGQKKPGLFKRLLSSKESQETRARGSTYAMPQPHIVAHSRARTGFGSDIVVGSFLTTGATCAAVAAPYEGSEGAVYLFSLQANGQLSETASLRLSIPQNKTLNGGRPPTASDSPLTYWPRFGAKMGRLALDHQNGDGSDILVVTSPGTSAVHFFYPATQKSPSPNTIDGVETLYPLLSIQWNSVANLRYGASGVKLVGESIAIGDISGDGYPDVAVGVPYMDLGGSAQTGEVYVLDGHALSKLLVTALGALKAEPYQSGQNEPLTLVMDIADIESWIVALPVSEPQRQYALFGSQLAISAKHRLLLVGAGGLSKVWGFDKHHRKVFVVEGDSNTSFGRDFVATHNDSLVIGSSTSDVISPNTGRVKCAQCGTVYIYEMSSSTPGGDGGTNSDFKLQLRQKLHDEQTVGSAFTKYGRTGIIDDHGVLHIASPYPETNKGSVWSVDLKSDYKQLLTVKNGPSPFNTQFGRSIAMDPASNQLLVGMPTYDSSDPDRQSGAVAQYNLK